MAHFEVLRHHDLSGTAVAGSSGGGVVSLNEESRCVSSSSPSLQLLPSPPPLITSIKWQRIVLLRQPAHVIELVRRYYVAWRSVARQRLQRTRALSLACGGIDSSAAAGSAVLLPANAAMVRHHFHHWWCWAVGRRAARQSAEMAVLRKRLTTVQSDRIALQSSLEQCQEELKLERARRESEVRVLRSQYQQHVEREEREAELRQRHLLKKTSKKKTGKWRSSHGSTQQQQQQRARWVEKAQRQAHQVARIAGLAAHARRLQEELDDVREWLSPLQGKLRQCCYGEAAPPTTTDEEAGEAAGEHCPQRQQQRVSHVASDVWFSVSSLLLFHQRLSHTAHLLRDAVNPNSATEGEVAVADEEAEESESGAAAVLSPSSEVLSHLQSLVVPVSQLRHAALHSLHFLQQRELQDESPPHEEEDSAVVLAHRLLLLVTEASESWRGCRGTIGEGREEINVSGLSAQLRVVQGLLHQAKVAEAARAHLSRTLLSQEKEDAPVELSSWPALCEAATVCHEQHCEAVELLRRSVSVLRNPLRLTAEMKAQLLQQQHRDHSAAQDEAEAVKVPHDEEALMVVAVAGRDDDDDHVGDNRHLPAGYATQLLLQDSGSELQLLEGWVLAHTRPLLERMTMQPLPSSPSSPVAGGGGSLRGLLTRLLLQVPGGGLSNSSSNSEQQQQQQTRDQLLLRMAAPPSPSPAEVAARDLERDHFRSTISALQAENSQLRAELVQVVSDTGEQLLALQQRLRDRHQLQESMVRDHAAWEHAYAVVDEEREARARRAEAALKKALVLLMAMVRWMGCLPQHSSSLAAEAHVQRLLLLAAAEEDGHEEGEEEEVAAVQQQQSSLLSVSSIRPPVPAAAERIPSSLLTCRSLGILHVFLYHHYQASLRRMHQLCTQLREDLRSLSAGLRQQPLLLAAARDTLLPPLIEYVAEREDAHQSQRQHEEADYQHRVSELTRRMLVAERERLCALEEVDRLRQEQSQWRQKVVSLQHQWMTEEDTVSAASAALPITSSSSSTASSSSSSTPAAGGTDEGPSISITRASHLLVEVLQKNTGSSSIQVVAEVVKESLLVSQSVQSALFYVLQGYQHVLLPAVTSAAADPANGDRGGRRKMSVHDAPYQSDSLLSDDGKHTSSMVLADACTRFVRVVVDQVRELEQLEHRSRELWSQSLPALYQTAKAV